MTTTWREVACITVPSHDKTRPDGHVLVSSGQPTSVHRDDLLALTMPYHRTMMTYTVALEVYRAIGEWLDQQEAKNGESEVKGRLTVIDGEGV